MVFNETKSSMAQADWVVRTIFPIQCSPSNAARSLTGLEPRRPVPASRPGKEHDRFPLDCEIPGPRHVRSPFEPADVVRA